MQRSAQNYSIVILSTIGVCFFVFLGIRQYGYNVSTLLHMDTRFGEEYFVPPGVVLYEDGGYDGMAYYQIAREVPALFLGGETKFGSAYRFQRILFPLLGYAMAFGKDPLLPSALLILNVLSMLGTLLITLHIAKGKNLHAIAIVFNPAMLVGILYSLTEPVSMFFLMLFFWQFEKKNHTADVLSISALFLSLLARETTVFLIALLVVWSIYKREWKNLLWYLVPVLLLLAWQYYLQAHFGAVAFQANSNFIDFSFGGPATLIGWLLQKPMIYQLSSLPLLLFVLALALYVGREVWRTRTLEIYWFLLFGLLGTMLAMDAHIWGAVTSIGRVVTPLYPVYVLYAAKRDTLFLRGASLFLVLFSIIVAVGVASAFHPYRLS